MIYFEAGFLGPSFMVAGPCGGTVVIGNTGRTLCAVQYKITKNTKWLSGSMPLATGGVVDGYRIKTVEGRSGGWKPGGVVSRCAAG
jgi:hypothetical protein